jgi:hypothetical protein
LPKNKKGLKPTRQIGGETFMLWETSHTKTRAKQEAKRIRETHGLRARVVPVPKTKNYHRVFVRPKKGHFG